MTAWGMILMAALLAVVLCMENSALRWGVIFAIALGTFLIGEIYTRIQDFSLDAHDIEFGAPLGLLILVVGALAVAGLGVQTVRLYRKREW